MTKMVNMRRLLSEAARLYCHAHHHVDDCVAKISRVE
eukprot:COSAG05_NODE_15583_length_366_cov_0.606742_1_plen_36_part_10